MPTTLTVLAVAVFIFIILQIVVIWYLRRKATSSNTSAKRKSDLIDKAFSKQIGEE